MPGCVLDESDWVHLQAGLEENVQMVETGGPARSRGEACRETLLHRSRSQRGGEVEQGAGKGSTHIDIPPVLLPGGLLEQGCARHRKPPRDPDQTEMLVPGAGYFRRKKSFLTTGGHSLTRLPLSTAAWQVQEAEDRGRRARRPPAVDPEFRVPRPRAGASLLEADGADGDRRHGRGQTAEVLIAECGRWELKKAGAEGGYPPPDLGRADRPDMSAFGFRAPPARTSASRRRGGPRRRRAHPSCHPPRTPPWRTGGASRPLCFPSATTGCGPESRPNSSVNQLPQLRLFLRSWNPFRAPRHPFGFEGGATSALELGSGDQGRPSREEPGAMHHHVYMPPKYRPFNRPSHPRQNQEPTALHLAARA